MYAIELKPTAHNTHVLNDNLGALQQHESDKKIGDSSILNRDSLRPTDNDPVQALGRSVVNDMTGEIDVHVTSVDFDSVPERAQ